jgi:HlyD family secretion protein
MSKLSILIIILILFLSISCSDNSAEHQYTGVLEGTSVQVPALTPGQITQIPVNTGELVKKGQLLAMVDSIDLIYQREQLVATLQELEIQTEIAQSNLSRANKDYTYLKTKQDRIANLYKSQSTTKQNLDDITNSLQTSQTAVSNARNALGSIAAGKKQVEAKIKSVNKRINDTKIIAPTGGIITNLYYEEGEAVPLFGSLLEIIDTKKMEVKIYISETRLSQVQYGQQVSVSVDGLDKTLDGTVIWVSPKAEFTPKTILTPNTRTSLVYAVKISITNEEGILKHGMPVVINLK